MGRIPSLPTCRLDERDDCVHYSDCLTLAAQGKSGRTARGHSGGDRCVPCLGCRRYEKALPELHSAWAQRGDYQPWGRG
jgi:hypothetical protein